MLNGIPLPLVTDIIVDTDVGVDDCGAVFMALGQDTIRVHGFTTVFGNCPSKQAVANLSRISRLVKKQVPVYLGANEPFIKNSDRHIAAFYHGHDGFGDVPEAEPNLEDNDFDNYIKADPAALFLIKKAKKLEGNLTLVCLGPLTNIALAIKLDPEFCGRIRSVYLMGGNMFGMGNVTAGTTAEFNFQGDPEAAHIVLSQMNCPVIVAPWELYSNIFTENTQSAPADAHLQLENNGVSRFMREITGVGMTWLQKYKLPYGYCDEMAMAACINPSIILETLQKPGIVELHGLHTRGQIAVDWMNEDAQAHKITFIKKFDVDQVQNMMLSAVQKLDKQSDNSLQYRDSH